MKREFVKEEGVRFCVNEEHLLWLLGLCICGVWFCLFIIRQGRKWEGYIFWKINM